MKPPQPVGPEPVSQALHGPSLQQAGGPAGRSSPLARPTGTVGARSWANNSGNTRETSGRLPAWVVPARLNRPARARSQEQVFFMPTSIGSRGDSEEGA